jgi:hypothetical protein
LQDHSTTSIAAPTSTMWEIAPVSVRHDQDHGDGDFTSPLKSEP